MCFQAAGLYLGRLDRSTEAADSYERAISLYTTVGVKGERLVLSLKSLAFWCNSSGRVSKGLRHLAEAEAALAEMPSRLIDADYRAELAADISMTMGRLLHHVGQFDRSVACLQAVMNVAFHAGHPQHYNALCNLANVMDNMGDIDRSAEYVTRAITYLNNTAVKSPKERADLQYFTSRLLLQRGETGCVLAGLAAAQQQYQQILPPDHPQHGLVLQNVAQAHRRLGQTAEADEAAAGAAAVARRSQSACSGPMCVRKLREDGEPQDVCIKCRRTFYCGKDCQTADWKREGDQKAECKALIAEGNASKASAGPRAPIDFDIGA